jgi:hypothetical protein
MNSGDTEVANVAVCFYARTGAEQHNKVNLIFLLA